MSTHSKILKRQFDGSIKAIYCHYDGYLSNNGILLLKHYSDINKVSELIELGDISQLSNNVRAEDDSEHSFDNPQEGIVVAYHRDRKEELIIEEYSNLDDFIMQGNKEEYNYYFDGENWFVSYSDDNVFLDLTEEISKQQ